MNDVLLQQLRECSSDSLAQRAADEIERLQQWVSELQDTMNMDERFLTHREHHELTRLQAAEIERLQQQVGILLKAYELLRTATFGAHSAHFDPTHGSGSGCPECTRMREIRAEADNLSKRGE